MRTEGVVVLGLVAAFIGCGIYLGYALDGTVDWFEEFLRLNGLKLPGDGG